MNAKKTEFNHDDIERARQQNVISAESADSLLSFLETTKSGGFPSEEPFRLVGGFNDIFVALASLLVFFGISAATEGSLAGLLLIAVAGVGLSEYFTRRLRLRLSSILYSCTVLFVLGHVFLEWFTTSPLLQVDQPPFWEVHRLSDVFPVWSLSAASLMTALAGVGYWYRYRVPITIALVTGCVVLAIEFVVLDLLRTDYFRTVILTYGVLVFAFAIYWDRMDPARLKLHSDVAFWLHLLAAPLIVNSVYTWFLMGDDPDAFFSFGEPTLLGVLAVFVTYVIFGLVALLINRRAFIVAGLGYVIIAILWSLNKYESSLDNVAVSLILMGLVFLVLAVWWDRIRNFLVGLLPNSLQAVLNGHHEPVAITIQSEDPQPQEER